MGRLFRHRSQSSNTSHGVAKMACRAVQSPRHIGCLGDKRRQLNKSSELNKLNKLNKLNLMLANCWPTDGPSHPAWNPMKTAMDGICSMERIGINPTTGTSVAHALPRTYLGSRLPKMNQSRGSLVTNFGTLAVCCQVLGRVIAVFRFRTRSWNSFSTASQTLKNVFLYI